MKVLVNRGIEGITFRDNVAEVAVDLGICVRMERIINGEGLDLTNFQEYSIESILDYYESSVPITLSDPENLLYFEVKYSIENDIYIRCYITNRLNYFLDDIFTAMQKEFLVIDASKGIKYKIYNADGEIISED